MRKMICTLLVVVSLTGLTGCQANPGAATGSETTVAETVVKINLADIHTAVKTAYGESYIPNMEYDEQTLLDIYGIGKDLYDSYIAEGPMISVHVDNFVAIEAKKGKGEEVEKLLAAYRDNLIKDSMQYPMNIAKVQASEVVRHGDYVFFIMLGAISDEAETMDEEAALTFAKEENQIAVKTINGFFQ